MKQERLKGIFNQKLSEPARDNAGDIIRRERAGDGLLHVVSRAEIVVDKCIGRAERGDMLALKLIVDIVEPKQLRVAIDHAVTVEHVLHPVLQSIIDKLTIPVPIDAIPAKRLTE